MEKETITEVPELRDFFAANLAIIKRLEVLSGVRISISRWYWISNLYDTYINEKAYKGPNFYPPRWADPKTLAVMEKAFELSFSIWAHDQAYLRLWSGPLLLDIVESMVRAAKDGERSLQLFTIVDRNLAVFEQVLDIYSGNFFLKNFSLV